MISIKNYKKQYGGNLITAVPELTLEHNVYWLMGENGSGKTTLVKSIAGLIPFEGSISVDGRSIAKERMQYRSIVNYAEAEPAYPAFLTGTDLLALYAQTMQATPGQIQELTSSFGITGFMQQKIGTYSSGMAKKLSLVLGFMGNPRLILLDEPLITLDQQAVANLTDTIAAYFRKGVSFIITSHQEITLPGIQPARLLVKNKTVVRL